MSSCVHCLKGIIIFHSSRGQKVVSWSSAETELHGLVIVVPLMALHFEFAWSS